MVETIEHIYDLSPAQRSTIAQDSDQFPTRIIQVHCGFTGHFDRGHFERAWRHTAECYATLRTVFLGEGQSLFAQAVYQRVNMPIDTYDWSGLEFEVYQARFEAYCTNDRCRSFDLTTPPLMRIAVFQSTTTDEYDLVWSFPALLLDIESAQTIIDETFAYYAVFRQGYEPVHQIAPLYQHYVAWSKQQRPAIEQFWRATLRGIAEPTLVAAAVRNHTTDYRTKRLMLGSTVDKAIQRTLVDNHLHIQVLISAAWALVLSRAVQTRTVLFGIETGCSGVDASSPYMIGRFATVVPLRVQLAPNITTLQLLGQIQALCNDAERNRHATLGEIQSWSSLCKTTSVFDSVIAADKGAHWEDCNGTLEPRTCTFYEPPLGPFTLKLSADKGATLALVYDARRVPDDAVETYAYEIEYALEQLTKAPEQRLDHILGQQCWGMLKLPSSRNEPYPAIA